MGLSSTKTKQTNDPSAFAKPYVTQGVNALGSAFAQTQPTVDAITGQLGAALPGLGERALGANPTLDPAIAYNNDVLGGRYLDAGNPYLQSQIDQTAADVRSRVGAAFTNAGRTGSGANVNALSRGLATAENGLRYQNYSDERARMGQAAGLSTSLAGAQNGALGAYLQAAQAAVGIPMDAARGYASGVGSLVGGYNTQTGTSTPSLGAILAQIGGNAARAYTMGGM